MEHICASKAERLEVYCKAKSRVCSIIWVQSKCRVGQLRISDLHRREQITPIETIQIGKEAIVDCLVLEDIRTENLTGEKMPLLVNQGTVERLIVRNAEEDKV